MFWPGSTVMVVLSLSHLISSSPTCSLPPDQSLRWIDQLTQIWKTKNSSKNWAPFIWEFCNNSRIVTTRKSDFISIVYSRFLCKFWGSPTHNYTRICQRLFPRGSLDVWRQPTPPVGITILDTTLQNSSCLTSWFIPETILGSPMIVSRMS